MAKLDPFTVRRLTRFVEDHRRSTGQLPTLQDFEKNGIARELVDQAVRQEVLEQLYINLTRGNLVSKGPMVKGYKVKIRDLI